MTLSRSSAATTVRPRSRDKYLEEFVIESLPNRHSELLGNLIRRKYFDEINVAGIQSPRCYANRVLTDNDRTKGPRPTSGDLDGRCWECHWFVCAQIERSRIQVVAKHGSKNRSKCGQVMT